MISHSLMIAGITVLAAGTFLMRVAGYRLGSVSYTHLTLPTIYSV